MAAGDRSKSGKATDIVSHFGTWEFAFCGRKNVGYATTDWNDVTCKSCLKSKEIGESVIRQLGDGASNAQAYHRNRLLDP